MRQDVDFEALLRIDDRHQAADVLGCLLYGLDDARLSLFREAFLEGVVAAQTSRWLPAPGLGPWAVGTTLGAVWYERR